MKKLNSLISIEKSIYFFIIALLIFFVIRTPVVYFPDSKGYLNMTIYRSFGYSFFIKAHQFLLGAYFEKAIVISQFILNIASSLYVIRCLKRSVALDKWLAILLFILLLFPVFFRNSNCQYHTFRICSLSFVSFCNWKSIDGISF